MRKLLLTLLLASAAFAHAGWYYWDHGRLMWTNKYGVVEDVQEDRDEERAQELQDKLDEINEKLDQLKSAEEEQE